MKCEENCPKPETERDCPCENPGIVVKLNGECLNINGFPAKMIEGTVRGLLSSMKGYEEGASIEIEIPEKR